MLFLSALILTQLSVLPFFNLGKMTPNLILVLVIWLVFHANESRVITAVFLGGLLVDLYSANFFGLQTLALLIAAWFAWFLVNRVFSRHGSFYVLAVSLIIGQLIYQIALYLAQLSFSYLRDMPAEEIGLFFSWYLAGQIFLSIIAIYWIDFFGKRIFKLPQ